MYYPNNFHRQQYKNKVLHNSAFLAKLRRRQQKTSVGLHAKYLTFLSDFKQI
jgi:hypothetical protein